MKLCFITTLFQILVDSNYEDLDAKMPSEWFSENGFIINTPSRASCSFQKITSFIFSLNLKWNSYVGTVSLRNLGMAT